jgi:hypothetical protein
MKKSAHKYLIASLMLVLFASVNFLANFTDREKKSRYSIEKEKTEKANFLFTRVNSSTGSA